MIVYTCRGGGADSSWHKSGSGLFKLNSIHDYVSCANYLVNENFVHRNQLAGIGHSAGSLLLGAAINMNPDLFRAAILKVNLTVLSGTFHLFDFLFYNFMKSSSFDMFT